MIGRPLFGGDRAFDAAFYRENDRRKFAQRRLFFFASVMVFALFAALDPVMGAGTAERLFWPRVAMVVVMSAIWGVFAASTDHRTREAAILAFALVAPASLLLLVALADGPAADYYPFGMSTIQIVGMGLIMPQFRTLSIAAVVCYLAFWGTVPFGRTSVEVLYANAFMLTVSTVAVIVGSYTREAMERDQFRKEAQLAEARDEALTRGREAVEANRAKSHMMANVSHELRTPMNAIIGFSEAMKEEVFGPITPDKYREYVSDIHRSGRILLSNIEDMIDIARIETHKMGWRESVFRMDEAMDIAVKASRATLPHPGIRIRWRDLSGGATVSGDIDRVCQVMINLLNNAGKFSPPDGTIDMTFAAEKAGWTLRVADRGCGIPPEDLERIREPFAQVGADGFSVAKGGLGLGLAITTGIVRRLDGRLDIESAVDRGTTVLVRLPGHRVTAPAAALSHAS